MHQVEGLLVSLAESWPLQLSVQPSSGPAWSVTLDERASVLTFGRASQVRALRPGMRVIVRGRVLGPYALLGVEIEAT